MPLLESPAVQAALPSHAHLAARLSRLGGSLTAQVALAFLLLAFLTRLALMAISLDSADAHAGSWLLAFLVGFISDFATLAFALLPVAIFDLLLPRRFPRFSLLLRILAFTVIVFTLIFLAASEFIFWQEFGSRFNFIAVDYLIYTREVVENIMQSYPVKPLLALFAAISLGLALLLHPHLKSANRLTLKERAMVLAVVIVAGALSWTLWSVEKPAVTRNNYSNELAGNGLYNFFSAYRHNEISYASHYPTLPAATVDATLATLATLHQAGKAQTPAAAALPRAPKHLVMITVESLSADYLGSFGNTQGLTPNLDALAHEGLLFTNLYAAGTRTVRGLEALSLSVPPTPGQSIVRRPRNENLATLGAALNRHGFHSWYLYGGYGYFDNMNYYFSHNGYEVLDRNDIPRDEVGFANAWGVSDEYLFTQAEELMDREAAANPQFLMVMTTSNHRPYTYPENRIDIPSPGGRAGAVKYTDYAIGKFLSDAKSKPWFKDTLFVIVADHCASSAGKTSLPVNRYHIPAIFYAPALLAPAQENRIVSQIDLPPTLLALLGLPAEPRFFGSNVWQNPDYAPRAFIANYQELGYLKNDHLVVLAPRQPARQYQVEELPDGQERQTEVTPDPKLVQEAIAYYQGAATDFRDGSMKLANKEVARHVPPRQ